MKISEQYRQLKPYIVEEIRAIVGNGGLGGGGTTLASVPLHGLADLSKHSGLLAESQAPWAVTQSVYSAHTANSNAHHDTATAGTLISLSGQQVSVSNGSARYQVPVTGVTPFAPAWTALSSLAGNGLSFTGGAFVVGASGLGLSTDATHVVLTSSSNPGAAASILASDANGALTLQGLQVGPKTYLSNTNNVSSGGPDVAFSGNMLMATTNSMYWAIDSNNTGTGFFYSWRNNGNTTNAATELMRLTDGGQLKIGAGAPSYALDVTGDGLFSSSVLTPTLTTASGALTVAATTDVLLQPTSNLVKLQANVNLQSHNFASQTTGMRVTNDGQGDFRYIFTDELHAKAFIADLEQALAGGQIIAKSVTKLSANWNVTNRGAASTITVDDLPSATGMACFQAGDVVGVRTFARSGGSLTIGTAYGVVTAYSDNGNGTQNWTFTRAATTGLGSGSLAGGTTIQAGAIVIDYGVSGNGYHEVNAIDGAYGVNSPYSQVVTWSGGSPSATNAQTVRTRLGNLYGVFSVSGEFGLYAGDGTANSNQYLRISSKGVRLNNIPLQLWASGTQRVNIDATGTEVWFKDASSNTKLSWDGSTLAINGAVTALTGYVGGADSSTGWTIASGLISSANIRLYSGDTTSARVELGNGSTANTAGIRGGDGSTASGVAFWSGATHANRTSAPFRVTVAGSLVATDATITGSVTAGGGAVWMNSAGLGLDATTGKFTAATASWWYSTNRILSIGTTADLGAPTGAFIEALTGYTLTITAPTGITIASNTTFSGTVSVGANAVWHAGNFTPSNYATLAGTPVFTGTPKVNSNLIWHAGNDGSGSGLDADLLDNHDTSYFATAGHNHDSTYAALAGATFTGSITAPALYMAEQANTPSTPSDGTQFTMYMRNDKFVIAYNRSGTPYYVQFDLRDTSGAVTWTRSTTAP